jgi:hypothetical protein
MFFDMKRPSPVPPIDFVVVAANFVKSLGFRIYAIARIVYTHNNVVAIWYHSRGYSTFLKPKGTTDNDLTSAK